jgi:hypothetical protein
MKHHQQSTNHSNRRFQLPLEPEAEEALETWTTIHRVATTRLFLQFGKLHMAINAQKAGSTLVELKQLLSEMEDEALEWYLELADGIVAKLENGYGGPNNVTKYYAAIQAGAKHQESYRKLRFMFDTFLDE